MSDLLDPPDAPESPSSWLGKLWHRYFALVCRPPDDPPLTFLGVLRRYSRIYVVLWVFPLLWFQQPELDDWIQARIPGWPTDASFAVLAVLMAEAFFASALTLPIPDAPGWKKGVCFLGGYLLMILLPTCGHRAPQAPAEPPPSAVGPVEKSEAAPGPRAPPVTAARGEARPTWPARHDLSPLYSTRGGQLAAAPFRASASGTPSALRWEGAEPSQAPKRDPAREFWVQIFPGAGRASALEPLWEQRLRAEAGPVRTSPSKPSPYGFHQYAVRLEDPPALRPGETYWLSIAAVDHPRWLWARSSLEPAPALALRKGKEAWQVPVRQGLPAFALDFAP
jgi:hypothetical protein